MTLYFKRRWDEVRGDRYDDWGASWWLFEVDADGRVTRQIEMYDNGPTLKYGPENTEDQFGGLTDAELGDAEEWAPWSVTSTEFDEAWSGA